MIPHICPICGKPMPEDEQYAELCSDCAYKTSCEIER